MPGLARAIVSDPRMNKTEARYAATLELSRRVNLIREWSFQSVTLKLADDTRYTPDFLVIAADGVVEMHEVKGFWRDDALVKIKVAAKLFPFRFVSVSLVKGGGWETRAFSRERADAA